VSEPKRWSEDSSSLSADELRVLTAGLKPTVPRHAKRAVWLALGAQIPKVAAAASIAAPSSLGVVSLLKTAAVGLALGASTMGAVAVLQHETILSSPRVKQTPAALPSSQSHVEPSLVATPSLPSAEPAASVLEPLHPAPVAGDTRDANPPHVESDRRPAPSEAEFPVDATHTRDSESQRLVAARSFLRGGHAAQALAALDALRRELPNGELGQEREALTIEALQALGRSEEARRRGEAFLARYPASPHAAGVRRVVEAR
jgi:hypothetical protein